MDKDTMSYPGHPAMDPDAMAELVRRVLYAVSRRTGADKGYLLALFTGATAGLEPALSGLEALLLNGFSLRICLTRSAEDLGGRRIEERLLPWPNASRMAPEDWLGQLSCAAGVVVPMLSVNSLSRAVSLTADSLAGDIFLQALFMAKPVVAAIDGAAPGAPDRRKLGLDRGPRALQQAVADRLVQLADFGCRLTWARDLGRVGLEAVTGEGEPAVVKTEPLLLPAKNREPGAFRPRGAVRLVDAGAVRRAHRDGFDIRLGRNGLVTPLARELAGRMNVHIIGN